MNSKRIIAMVTTIALLFTCALPIFADDAGIEYEVFASEAETFSGDGFKVAEDNSASESSSVVSTAANSALYCNFTKGSAYDNTDWYVMVRAYGKTKGDKLTAKVNNKKYDFGDIYTNSWKWVKVKVGKINTETCEFSIIANNKNIRMDKIIVTNDPNYSYVGKTENIRESADAGNYYPANTKATRFNYPEMRENEQGGSWFAEAEDAKLGKKMEKVFDETASGEYYAHAKSGTATDPASLDAPSIAFTFNVKEKGKYMVWVRYFTPAANQKSSWISIDGQNYYRLDTRITTKWTWAKTNTVNLDVGLHTLDVKYRQNHHRLDCFIVTKDGYTPKNLGSLPGEEDRPYALSYAERVIPRIYVNGAEVTTNAKGYVENGAKVVSVRHFCEKVGIAYHVDGDSGIVLYKDRDYVKLIDGKEYIIYNGKQVPTAAPVKRLRDEIMVDFDALAKVFGFDYYIDDNNQIYVTYEDNVEVTWEEALAENGMETTGHALWLDYSYPCANDFDAVSAWYTPKGGKTWLKAHDPVYYDGAIRGGLEDLRENNNYIIKLSIVRGNEVQNIYKAGSTIKLENLYPTAADIITHSEVGQIKLVETYENLGVYLDYDGDIANTTGSDTFFRVKGTEEWTQAYDMYTDKRLNQFRGTIPGLKENTTYEVKMLVYDGGETKEYIQEATMWADEVPIAKEYKLSEVYDPDAEYGTLSLQYLKGSPDGWIKIKGVEGDNTINASKNYIQAVWLSNCEYVILEDLIIKGGYKHGVHVTNNTSNVRILNCDISQFAVPSLIDPEGGMYYDYTYSYSNPNLNSGVRIVDTGKITVERCYIHDPCSQTNDWDYGHPAGPSALSMRSKGQVVVRYNDCIGSEYWRWNDVIEGFYNGERTGGPAKNCDIYGNVMIIGQDDSIELEGGEENIRLYNNLMGGSLCGASTIPIELGPCYIWGNVWYEQGTEDNGTGAISKAGGGDYKASGTRPYEIDGSWGAPVYYFNNTMYGKGNGLGVRYQYGGTTPGHLMFTPYVTRNNIIDVSGGQLVLEPENDPRYADFDYDLFWSPANTGESAANVYEERHEKHKVVADPLFTNTLEGVVTLQETSPAIDAGEDLYQFTAGYKGNAPDIGAIEYGSDPIFPVRDVNIKSDRWFVRLDPTIKSSTFQISLIHDGEDEHVRILETEFDKTWLTVTDENGNTEFTVSKDKPVTIKVTADSEALYKAGQMERKGRVGLIFKLDSGYSIPVQVYFYEGGDNPYRTH